MNSFEAIKEYRAAKKYREVILEACVPPVFQRDFEALTRYKEVYYRGLGCAGDIMRQAELTVERLPRQELREVVSLRFLKGMTLYETAEKLSYCLRTIGRFERQATEFFEHEESQQTVEHLEAGNQPGGP